jgi:hypothetical protein
MKVAILGAGATAGTFPEVCAAADFLQRLDRVRRGKPPWANEYPALAAVVEDAPTGGRAQKGLEEIWTHLDYYAKLNRVVFGDPVRPDADRYPGASPQLRRALLEAYALRAEMPDVLADARAGVRFTLRTILDDLPPGSVIVSFNWDTAAEEIADLLGKRLSSPPLRVLAPGEPWTAPDKITLVKPHGSLSWRHDDVSASPCRVQSVELDGSPRLTPMRPAEVSDTRVCEPLVLGAVPIKSELFDRLQQPEHPDVYRTVFFHWVAVVRAIAEASELVVAGYSFPKEDGYGRFLIREGVDQRRRASRPSLPIAYYSLENLGGAFRDIFDEFGKLASWTHRGELLSPAFVKARP